MSDRQKIIGGFYDNLTSDRMNAATTAQDIRAAMSPSSRANEALFWKYLSERHDRTIIAGRRGVSIIEKIGKEMYEKDPLFFTKEDMNTSPPKIEESAKVSSDEKIHISMDKDEAVAMLMKQAEELKAQLDAAHTLLAEKAVGSDEQGEGLIYFIIDKDFPYRAKIGRTQESDLKKLRTRYGTTLNPFVFAYLSDDMVHDETEILKLMRDNELMWPGAGTEKIKNNKKSRAVFMDFFFDKHS
jgi:hypothetical protein